MHMLQIVFSCACDQFFIYLNKIQVYLQRLQSVNMKVDILRVYLKDIFYPIDN